MLKKKITLFCAAWIGCCSREDGKICKTREKDSYGVTNYINFLCMKTEGSMFHAEYSPPLKSSCDPDMVYDCICKKQQKK